MEGCGGSTIDSPTQGSTQHGPVNVGDGGATFSSGLAADKTVGSLTDTEHAALCDALNRYLIGRFFGGAITSFCKFAALSGAGYMSPANDGQLQVACEDLYNGCIASPPPESTLMTIQTCPAQSPQCTATVGELEQCYTDSELTLEASWAALPDCRTLTLNQLPIKLTFSMQPASCTSYSQKCPGQ
jgi:hypothetical protein